MDFLESNDVELTNEAFQKFADINFAQGRFNGIPLTDSNELSFEGSDENSVVFYSETDSAYYQCDRETYDHTIMPLEQPTSCEISAYDINTDYLDRFVFINYQDGILLTLKGSNLVAYYQDMEFIIPTLGDISQYTIANTTVPTIIPNAANDNQAYVLMPDGSVATYTLPASVENFVDIDMNDKYIVSIEVGESNELISTSFCEYSFTGSAITCDTEDSTLQPLPINFTELTSAPEDMSGFIPYVKIGKNSELLAFYIGYKETLVTPILLDLETGISQPLSSIRLAALKTTLGEEYVNSVYEILVEMVTMHLADSQAPNITPELNVAALDDLVAVMSVSAYPAYVESGNIATAVASASNISFQDSYIGAVAESTFISANSIKTSLAKYNLKTDILISGKVTLQGSEVPSNGIEVVLLGDMGDRLEITTDNNGIFSILNPVSSTYELTFSTNNHVFECASENTSNGTFGEFEMLAGDLNNDGEINSTDQWRFYFRAFYPSTDFDVNNDGEVNNTDRDIIRANQGATQCDI